MIEEILEYSEALTLLKQGLVLIDENLNSFYVIKKDRLINYRNGSRYCLSLEDFECLFSKHHFKVYESKQGIDESKDLEYYAFKHK